MNTPGIRAIGWGIVIAAMLASQAALSAEISSSQATVNVRIAGIYKVISSSDPLFPVTKTREYFLDFGSGIQRGKSSGSVAISLRQNPSVKVRMMAWQYFPEQETLLIGNPFAEGSRKAVATGMWQVRGYSNALVWKRGNHQVVLRRPAPGDY